MLKAMSISSFRNLFLLPLTLAACNSSEPIKPMLESGLRASYFNTEDFSGAAITRVEPNINFDWAAGAPQDVAVNNFSARFEGSFIPKYSEVYTFSANADEGLRVWINGVKIIDRWALHRHTDFGKLKLKAGERYAIKIEYHDATGNAALKLFWRSPSQAREIIPPTAFYTEEGLAEGLPENASLRVLAEARGIKLGAEINTKGYDDAANPAYREIMAREFNHVQPGGECLATSTHSDSNPLQLKLDARGRLEPFDTLLDAAEVNKQSLQCFHLVWYEESRWTPFMNRLSVEDRRTFIRNRITDMMTRYKGRIKDWNVVNEAFTDPAQGAEATVRPREYSKGEGEPTHINWLYDLGTGTEYIAEAFKTARAADPDAKLFYNDYSIEDGLPENDDLTKATPNKKWNAVLEMVRDFKTRPTPIPIDGVGFQTHKWLDSWATPEVINGKAKELNRHFRQLHAIDSKLEARITELDLSITNPSAWTETVRLERQGLFYGAMLKACLTAPNCTGFSTWGISDQYSWLADPSWGGNANAKPLMFDSSMEAKPAYYAVRDALRGI
jgi:endo-1,4-beta-xylanase